MKHSSKKLKIVQNSKTATPKMKWLQFSKAMDKSSPDYMGMITSDAEYRSQSDEKRLEAMVREQLKTEFPNIENSSSYEMLVDAVIYNIKRKQLQTTDDIEIQ